MHSSIGINNDVKSNRGFKLFGFFSSEKLQCVDFEKESLRGEQVRLLRILRISL